VSKILREVDDGLAVVTVNRPSLRNAMTLAMGRGLGDICRDLDGSRDYAQGRTPFTEKRAPRAAGG
jgi:enoyl-CoA hydratase/carnithine racemase